MTAGVAVVFKACFGKPETYHFLTNHLALQSNLSGASVYSLITKARYFGKPHKTDYDVAFRDLTESFIRRGLRHLICSPIGCIRDRVSPNLFVDHILKFQQRTKAKVTIVCYSHKPHQTLKNGLSNKELILRIKHLLSEKSQTFIPLEDDRVAHPITPVVAVPMDPIPDAINPRADAETTLCTSTAIEESPTDVQLTSVIASQCEKVIVAPGDLTFKEALEQSNGDIDSATSDKRCSGLGGCRARLPASTLNSMDLVIQPIK